MKMKLIAILALTASSSFAFGAIQSGDYTCKDIKISVQADGVVFDGDLMKYNSHGDRSWKVLDEENNYKLLKQNKSIDLLLNFDSLGNFSSLGFYSLKLNKDGKVKKIVSKLMSTEKDFKTEETSTKCK